MSVENVEKFYALLSKDKKLIEKITKASEKLKNRLTVKGKFGEKDLAEIYTLIEPFAREVGCPFTLAELESYKKGKVAELTDEEIAAASGGGCGCFVGGGGSTEGVSEGCGCVIGGSGTGMRLLCFVAGWGKASS